MDNKYNKKIERLKEKGCYSNLEEILKINPMFDINIKYLNIFEDKLYNFFGPEIIAKIDYIDSDIYEYALNKGFGRLVKMMLKINPKYFHDVLKKEFYYLEYLKLCVIFFGIEIISRIPYEYIIYIENMIRLKEILKYIKLKKIAKKDNDLKIKIANVINDYCKKRIEIDGINHKKIYPISCVQNF